jgi:hypothetical protein
MSSTPRVWNNENRERLFELVYQDFGPFNTKDYRYAGIAPKTLTKPVFDPIYEEMYQRMIADGEFANYGLKNPKSKGALQNQVAWATTHQDLSNSSDITRMQRKMRNRNRDAAYRSGWMTLHDIIELEKMEEYRKLSLSDSSMPIDDEDNIPVIPVFE